MIAYYKVRDAMGRESWIEQVISDSTFPVANAEAVEDDIQEALRRR